MSKLALKYLKNILILLFFAISIYIIATNVELSVIREYLSSIPKDKLLILGFISLLTSTLKAVRLKRVTMSPLRMDRFAAISYVHNILAVLIPFKLGELSFPLLIKRYSGEEFSRSFAQLIVVRLMDAIFVFTIGMVIVFSMFDEIAIKLFTLFGLIGVVFALLLMRSDKFIIFLKRFKWLNPITKIFSVIDQIPSAKLLESAFYTTVIWTLTYLFAFLMIRFLNVDLSLIGTMVWNTLFALAAAIPFQTPGMVGTAEAIGVFVFEYFGVQGSAATPLELSVILHAISLGLGALWGIIGGIYLWIFVKPYQGPK
jgi:uncharacterized membrane protein YbhN (UPF0104 family)